MDFGVVGLEDLAGPDASPPASAAETHRKGLGSGSSEDDWRSSKMAKTDNVTEPDPMLGTPLLRSNSLLSPEGRQKDQMLSFSDVRANHRRNTGFASGSLSTSMHVPLVGVKGSFTPSQWIELEHQALIYKYITSNVTVPFNLLIPLKKSIYPYGLCSSSSGSLHPNTLAWGYFHLSFSGCTDPEPGRCRRTDGKKWRCSRDAVADQKYCERHINRGRHRSRKPVEGHIGHAASGATNSKVVPKSSTMSVSMMPSDGGSNSQIITQLQLKSLQPDAANLSSDGLINRESRSGRVQIPQSVSLMSSSTNSKAHGYSYEQVPVAESCQPEFGAVAADGLLGPSPCSSFTSSKNHGSFLEFDYQKNQHQHPFPQYINDLCKDQPNHLDIAWPEELKSDWTQLSMTTPTTSDFSPSASSPMQEKHGASPLKLAQEFDSVAMNFGASSNNKESTQKQIDGMPISWGTSLGGPLGEVLTNIAAPKNSNNSSALNLLTERPDGCLHSGTSPMGVLQNTTYGSISTSSSCSSPKTETKTTIYEDVLSSPLASSYIPSL